MLGNVKKKPFTNTKFLSVSQGRLGFEKLGLGDETLGFGFPNVSIDIAIFFAHYQGSPTMKRLKDNLLIHWIL